MPVSRQARTEVSASFKHKMCHVDCGPDALKLGAKQDTILPDSQKESSLQPEAPHLLVGSEQLAAIEEEPPKLLMGDSTDSDSDESSQDDSPRFTPTGKQFLPTNIKLELACRPLLETLALQSGRFRTYLIESCFGLQGNDTLRAYPCVLDETTAIFFVWLGDTDLAAFTKHTFMNLCDFAEKN